MREAIVVGAGPAGAATARTLADAGFMVRVIESRASVGGNAFDEYDEHGILVHRYGAHAFWTNSAELVAWLSQFTKWIPGNHYVMADVNETLVPLPVSLATMTALTGEMFSEERFERYLTGQRVLITDPQNAEEYCLATFGRELYRLIFEGYTTKQWGAHPSKIHRSVVARIPLRFDWNTRYGSAKFHVTPRDGYTQMFTRMLDHPDISVFTSCKATLRDSLSSTAAVIWTGPLDAAFNYGYGRLPYRSLSFEWLHYDDDYVMPCFVVNQPKISVPHTRVIEAKHLTMQAASGTTVCFEYPEAVGEPFYPMPTDEAAAMADLYRAEADNTDGAHFVGRLAEYRYFNMDQAMLRGRSVADRIIKRAEG